MGAQAVAVGGSESSDEVELHQPRIRRGRAIRRDDQEGLDLDELEIPDIRTALGFLADREDSFRVSVVRSALGHGWDVVLRVDGSFDTQEAAADASRRIKQMLLAVRGLDHERWFSWEAP